MRKYLLAATLLWSTQAGAQQPPPKVSLEYYQNRITVLDLQAAQLTSRNEDLAARVRELEEKHEKKPEEKKPGK